MVPAGGQLALDDLRANIAPQKRQRRSRIGPTRRSEKNLMEKRCGRRRMLTMAAAHSDDPEPFYATVSSPGSTLCDTSNLGRIH